MTKDVSKQVEQFKDELRNEFKNLKESLERSMRAEERKLRTEIDDMKRSMDFISKNLDDVNLRFDATLTENSSLKKENEALQHKVRSLEREVMECQTSLVKTEQYSRNKNLEIKGVTETPNECLGDVLAQIGTAISEPICANDIDVIHRVATKDKTKKNIIVQFVKREKRDKVLEKAKKTKLTSGSLGLSLEASRSEANHPIFVNEHLCQYLKRLLGMAIARKREHGWKFVWIKNGAIFARRDETSSIVAIKRESDLDKITARG